MPLNLVSPSSPLFSDLQTRFDVDLANGNVDTNGWTNNASVETILAYKLIVQTGDTNQPIDKSRVGSVRLVDSDGYIMSDAFYNYLTAWRSNEPLAYEVSLSLINPEGETWIHVSTDVDLVIPQAPPITFARIPYYLHNLGSTADVIATIREVRTICENYVDQGLPNYPSGVVFTFWEQYLNIRFYLLISLVVILVAVFLIVTFMLMNPLAAFLLVVTLTITTTELFGFMGYLGIQLSAIPVVILVTSVGIGVEFTIHMLTGFLTAIGTRSVRTGRALSHMFAPVTHGAMSTLLGVAMLAASEFGFIVK